MVFYAVSFHATKDLQTKKLSLWINLHICWIIILKLLQNQASFFYSINTLFQHATQKFIFHTNFLLTWISLWLLELILIFFNSCATVAFSAVELIPVLYPCGGKGGADNLRPHLFLYLSLLLQACPAISLITHAAVFLQRQKSLETPWRKRN